MLNSFRAYDTRLQDLPDQEVRNFIRSTDERLSGLNDEEIDQFAATVKPEEYLGENKTEYAPAGESESALNTVWGSLSNMSGMFLDEVGKRVKQSPLGKVTTIVDAVGSAAGGQQVVGLGDAVNGSANLLEDAGSVAKQYGEEVLKDRNAYWQQAAAKKFMNDDFTTVKGEESAWSDPRAFANLGLSGLASTIPVIASTLLLKNPFIGTAFEAGAEANAARDEMQKKLDKYPDSYYQDLPDYVSLTKQGYSDKGAIEKIKADVVDETATQVGAITGLIGSFGDKYLGDALLNRTKGSIATNFAANTALQAGTEGAQAGFSQMDQNANIQQIDKSHSLMTDVADAAVKEGIGGGLGTMPVTVYGAMAQRNEPIPAGIEEDLVAAEEALQAEMESLNELKQKADNGDALDAAEYEAKKAGFDANLDATNKSLQAKAQAILEQNTFNFEGGLLDTINQNTGIDQQDQDLAERNRLNEVDARIQQKNDELANAEREVFADQFGLPSPESLPDPVLFGDEKGNLSTTQARDVPIKPIGVQSDKQPMAGKRYENAINNQFNIRVLNGKGEQVAPTDEQIKTAAKKEEEGKVLSVTQKNIVENLNAENIDKQDLLDVEQDDVATKAKGLEVVELPVNQLRLSDDVPNFKSNANKEGVVEPLGGKFDRTGVAPIQVWQRNNGNIEVISGRHRLDLAKRSGEETIPVQVHKESEGFGKKQAALLDTILNIRDGQGEVIDYVDAFRSGTITKETADNEGILARAKGKWAYGLANGGSEELIAGVRNGKIGAQSAHKVAQSLPGNNRAQQLVLSKILNEDMSVNKALNIGLAISAMQNQQEDTTGDMFGFDDSMMQEAEQISKIVTKKQKTIQEDIAAVKGAAKNPKTAKKYGVNVKNPSAVKAKIQELEQKKSAWEKWSTNSDLIAEVRNEMASDGNNSPLLSQYTQEDLDAREQAQAEAEAQEQEAIDREAAQKTSDMFSLTGSDNYLDEAAAQGQTDMLGELKDAETKPTTETTQEAAPEAKELKGVPFYLSSVYKTKSGRETTVSPKQAENNNEMLNWLFKNATAEAKANGDEMAAIRFGNLGGWRANGEDIRAASEYLFNKPFWTEIGDLVVPEKKNVKLSKSGQPFKTEKTARLSKTFKETPNADIVPVDGGFGVRESSNGQATVKQNEIEVSLNAYDYKDPGLAQRRINSIAEGEQIIASGKNTIGKKLSVGEIEAVKRSVNNTKKKLSEIPLVNESKPQPTYISRPVLNADEIVKWAIEQGFEKTLSPDDMHVTIAYSREPVSLSAVGGEVSVSDGGRSVEPLGNDGAVVLKFDSDKLQSEWQATRDAGASWDYESYQPHITITYDGGDIDVVNMRPFSGEIKLGNQVAEPLNEDAVNDYKEVESKPDQEAKTAQPKGLRDATLTNEATITNTDQGNLPGLDQDKTPAKEIDDVGEKLGGARKDEALSLSTQEKMSDDDFIHANPLSKIWPKSEVDAIQDKEVAAFASLTRESIPSKPRARYKLSRWVATVKAAREAMDTFAKNKEQFLMLAKAAGAGDMKNLVAKHELLVSIDRDQWQRVGRVTDFSGAHIYEDGKKVAKPSMVFEVDGRSKRIDGAMNAGDIVQQVKDALSNESEATAKKLKFEIRRNTGTNVYFINKKGDKDYSQLKTFDSLKDARAFIANNYDELAAEWEAHKERNNVKKTDIRGKENAPRIGKDHRNGRDIEPQEFIDTFGFRGAEFGNWVKQGSGAKDRQGLINSAYDAFMDLAAVVGVQPKALSLNGTLGIGFGSRGRSHYSAHFEPDSIVINLTKTKGAGSLAHEWFHALDNYFSRYRKGDIYEKRKGGVINTVDAKYSFVTYQPEPLMAHKEGALSNMTLAELRRMQGMSRSKVFNDENWTQDPKHPAGVRPEVETAFANLVNSLDASSMRNRAMSIDGGKTGYWSRIIERAARSFENYVITKMKDNGDENQFLANVIPVENWPRDESRYPYLLDEEMQPVAEAFDNLFETIETKETENGNVAFFSKEQYSGGVKIKASELQSEVDDFIQSLPGIDRYGLSIEILESPDEAFGKEAVAKSGAENSSGAYLAETKTLYLFNANINNKAQARRTLRHEILGHHGLNLFSVADKKAIFQAVTATRKKPAFKKDWEQVDSLYTELNDEQKAEEVIASIAEEQPGLAKRFLDAVVNKIIEILKKIGFIKKGEIIARSQLRGLVNAMADGISRGVPQQTFPKSGQQYSKNKKRFDDTTEEQEQFLGKIGRPETGETIKTKYDNIREKLGLKIKQGLVDKYAPLLELDKAVNGDDVVKNATKVSSWVLARMSEAGASALAVMLSGRRIKYNSAQKVINPTEGDGSKGFLNDMASILGSSAELDRFMGWVAAKRSVRLLAEGREHLFTEKEIGAGLLLDRGEFDGKSRADAYAEAYEKFKQYQNDVLDIATQADLVSKADREVWEDQFYVPFYRVDEDAKGNQLGISGGSLKPREAYKKLKGGTQNLNDLLENTLLNWNHLLSNSLKNIATKQAIDNAVEAGVAEKTSDAMKGKQATHVYVDGQKLVYDIQDSMVYDALTMLTHSGMNNFMMKAMRAFKRVFTNFTTASPQFIVANLIRDTLQAVAVTDGSNYNIAKNLQKGAKKYGTGLGKSMNDDRARILAAGGSFSFGYIYGRNPDDIKYGIDKEVGRVIKTPGDAKEATSLLWRSMVSTWDKYQSVNDMTENVNRMAIYDDIKNDSGNELYAAFQARDLMDFSAHGAWPAIRFLTDVVPFLNARLQGLDKIYRSGIKPTGNVLFDLFKKDGEKRSSETDKMIAKRFSAVTGALLMATLALRSYNEDDEEYRKLEDWQKDSYWFFRAGDNAFFIPKPFEVGAIATIGERLFEQAISDHPEVDSKLFWERVGDMFTDTFSFDPTPQMFNPAFEIWANEDKFTDRPIESRGMQRLSPERRFRSNTTETAKAISNSTKFMGDYQLSPVQIDHLIGGYLGWLGATANGFVDTIASSTMGKESPAKEWYEYQPARRFYRNIDKPTYTKYGTMFYKYLREVDQVYADLRDMQKFGEDYEQALNENKDKLKYRVLINRAQRALSKINQEMKIVKRSELPGELKRQRLDLLQTKKNNLQEMVVKKVIND